MKCSICGKPIVLIPSAAEREKDTLELIRSPDSGKLAKAPWETKQTKEPNHV